MAPFGGVGVALGYHARWDAWTLVAFLPPVTLVMHAFWRLSDPVASHVQQAMFAKNLSMFGAALLVMQFGSGSFSIDAASAVERAGFSQGQPIRIVT